MAFPLLICYHFSTYYRHIFLNIRKSLTIKHHVRELPEKRIIGISIRTCNQHKIDFNAPEAKIFTCVKRFFHEQLFNQIPDCKTPGTTYCGYTNYESDEHGWYTYFIGEETLNLSTVPTGFESFTIPAQSYAKFTTPPGNLPDVLRNAWFDIWQMKPKQFGGMRSYKVDFEVYDERANTPNHQGIVLDIYIGISRPLRYIPGIIRITTI